MESASCDLSFLAKKMMLAYCTHLDPLFIFISFASVNFNARQQLQFLFVAIPAFLVKYASIMHSDVSSVEHFGAWAVLCLHRLLSQLGGMLPEPRVA